MTEEEIKLIRGCAKGDAEAQKRLYLLYGPMIKGVCIRYAADYEKGMDLFHDVFVFILVNFKNYRHITSLGGWLRSIAVNKGIDYYRRQQRRQSVSVDELTTDLASDDTPFEVEAGRLTMDKLLSIINRLPEKSRMVVQLCLVDGVGQREAAAILNMTDTNLRTVLCRSKAKLREMVEAYLKANK